MNSEESVLEPFWVEYLPTFVQARLKSRKTLQKIVANMGWLFFDKALRMGVGLIVGVWAARYLGPDQFGVISYAAAFVGIFGSLTALGLDSIVVRELVGRPDERPVIIGTAFFLKLAASVFSFLICSAAIYFVKSGYLIRLSVIIIAATMVFQSFDVIRFWFESQVKSKYVVISQNGAFLLMSALKIVLLLSKAGLIWFVWAMLGEVALAAIGFLAFYKSKNEHIALWKFSMPEAVSLLTDSWPLILSGLAIFIYMRISQIMLGTMLDEKAVGIYAAALKISQVWYFIPTIVQTSVYPKFVQLYEESEERYTIRLVEIMSYFFWGSLAFSLGILAISNWIIHSLYGPAYAGSAVILSIDIFTGIFVNMGVIFSQRYILKNRQKIYLAGTVFGAVVNIVFNFALIPAYGAVGSAVATFLSQFSAPLFVAVFLDRSVGEIYLRAIFLRKPVYKHAN